MELCQVYRLFQDFFNDALVFIEEIKVDLQGLSMPPLPKMLLRTPSIGVQLLLSPDGWCFQPSSSGSSDGSGTGIRSISRGSNFVNPPA